MRSQSNKWRLIATDIGRYYLGRWAPPSRVAYFVIAAAFLCMPFALMLNKNIFYFSALLAFFVFLVFVVRGKWAKLILFGAYAFLAFAPAHVREPDTVRFRQALEFHAIEPDEIRSYQFRLIDLQKRRDECGPFEKRVAIQGKRLDGLDVQLKGADILERAVLPFYNMNRISIAFDPGDNESVEVRIRAHENATPVILLGPEFHRAHWKDVYPDAVYVVFENDNCRILYHAKPVVRRTDEQEGTRHAS